MVATEESGVRVTPAIGIGLVLLGVVVLFGIIDLSTLIQTLLGIGALVLGILILLGEFS